MLRLLLATPDYSRGDIVAAVGLAQSTVPEHQRILKAAGVISGEIDGLRVCYMLAPAALRPLAYLTATLTPPSGDACCLPDAKKTP